MSTIRCAVTVPLPDCNAAGLSLRCNTDKDNISTSTMVTKCPPVALLLLGLVCAHVAHASGPGYEASLYDMTRRSLSGSTTRAVSFGLPSSHHGPHGAPVVATCLKQTQWKNCRATGSMAGDDSAVLLPPVVVPGNDTAAPTMSPGVHKGIASGIYIQ